MPSFVEAVARLSPAARGEMLRRLKERCAEARVRCGTVEDVPAAQRAYGDLGAFSAITVRMDVR